MSKPVVSVVVTCYNKSAYVAEALSSIHEQSYPSVEVIIVDDGSTDGSLAILEKFANSHDNVQLIAQSNHGVSAARNTGIKAAKGLYVISLDADDRIDPTYVESCVEVLETHPDVKVVQTRARYFGAKTGIFQLPDYSYDALLWSNIIHYCAMYRRDDFISCGGYNTNMVHGLEDWDFWLSLLKPEDKVYTIDEELFHWRVLPDSRSIDAERYEMDCYRQLFNNHKDIYSSYLDRLVFFREKWSQFETLYGKSLSVYHSKAYRIGKLLTRPFNRLKKLFGRC